MGSFSKYAIQRIVPPFLYRFLSKVRLPEEGLDFTKFLLAKYAVRRGGSLIDGGAHIGFYSRCYAQLLKKKPGRLFSFEPNPYLFPLLQKTRVLPKEKHFFFQKALCKTSGEKKAFFVRPFSLAEDSSLKRPLEKKAFKRIEVESFCLDDLYKRYELKDCKLVKLDVEENEALVFEGAALFLQEVSPWIIFEYTQEEKKENRTLHILQEGGYVFFDLQTFEKVSSSYKSLLTDLVAVARKDEEELKNVLRSIEFLTV